MRKKHMRSIISLVLCFAMVLSLMFVSNVEASEKRMIRNRHWNML